MRTLLLATVLIACKSSPDSGASGSSPPTATVPSSPPEGSAATPSPAAQPDGAAVEARPATLPVVREDLSSTYASKSTAYYAGQVYDDKTQPITAAAATAGHWQALHEALRKRAAGLVEFNRTKGLPADRVAIYLYQGAAPDLSATKESIPNEGLLAVYDNTLTGEWRYCFGGTRSDAGRGGDLVRCVFDADGPTGAAYDLSAPAP